MATAAPQLPGAQSAWQAIDWRQRLRSASIDGRRLNYVELGSGPAVVLIHGLGGRWTNWLENIPQLAREHHVIALDLPGFGHSELPSQPISMAGYGRIVIELCATLGLERPTLIGNSMGGVIAVHAALAAPEAVRALVLASPAILSSEHERGRPWPLLAPVVAPLARWLGANADAVARRPRARRRIFRLTRLVMRADLLSPPIVAELVRGAGSPGFRFALRSLLGDSLRPRLQELRCPTLLVWGSHDRLVTAGDAGELCELIPDCRAVVLDDCGHLAMLEHADRFNELVEEFLREHSDALGGVTAPSAALSE